MCAYHDEFRPIVIRSHLYPPMVMSCLIIKRYSSSLIRPVHATELKTSSQTVMSTNMESTAKAGGIEETVTGTHSVGQWRSKSDYLVEYQYIPPGGTSVDALLNSCGVANLAQTLQCSGRGKDP
jgi:hypothetical protein